MPKIYTFDEWKNDFLQALEHMTKIQCGNTVMWHQLSNTMTTETFIEHLRNGTITVKDHEIISEFALCTQFFNFDNVFLCSKCREYSDRIVFIDKQPYCLECNKKVTENAQS